MTIDRRNVRALVRAIAYDVNGSRLGRVAQVFLDDRTDEPAWVAVDVTRTRGMRLLPLAGAGLKGRHLVIRAERSTVRSAPRIDLGDGQLSSQDESLLLEHFGLVSAGTDETAAPGEQRPASPWSDDTERETAWERPAQQQDSRDTNDLSHGWEQRGGDRAAASAGGGAGVAAGVGAGVGAGSFQQRDTAPSPRTEATAPPPTAEPTTSAGSTTPTAPRSEPPTAAAPATPPPPPAHAAPAAPPAPAAHAAPAAPQSEPTTATGPTTPAPGADTSPGAGPPPARPPDPPAADR